MLSRVIDKTVLEVFAKLWDRESPTAILQIIKEVEKKEAKRIEKVERLIFEGKSIVEALYEEKLISQDLYNFLLSAESNRNISTFAREKIKVDRSVAEIVKSLMFSLISPFMALVVSIGVVYIFIYKVVSGFNITEKHLEYLPSYFPFILKLNRSPIIFYSGVGGIFGFFVFMYATRRRFPFISGIYLMYERLKLYIHLYLSVSAGYNIDEALRKYKGELKKDVERILTLMDEGFDVVDAFMASIPGISPIEKPVLTVAVKNADTGSLRDLYLEVFDMLKTKLEATKQLMSTLALIVVAGVIVVAYMGILMPIIKAMKSMMG